MVKGNIGTKALKPTVSWKPGCMVIMPVTSFAIFFGALEHHSLPWHESQKRNMGVNLPALTLEFWVRHRCHHPAAM